MFLVHKPELEKNLSSISILFLFLTAIFIPMSRDLCAEASGNTIYIRSDGTIDPPTAPVQRFGDVYILASHINESMIIERDNVVVDGAGYLLEGEGAIGLTLFHRMNVTIKNFRIMGFLVGIKLEYTNNSTVSYSAVMNSSYDGIWLLHSDHNIILGADVANNGYGIHIQDSIGNALRDNVATTCENYGIYIESSANNTISRNVATSNDGGIVAYHSSQNTFADNVAANNKAIGIHIYDSNDTTLSCNTARDNGEYGLYLNSSGDTTVTGSVLSGNTYNFGVDGTSSYDFQNFIEPTSNIADGKPIYYVRGVNGTIFDQSMKAATIYVIDSANVTLKNLNLANSGCGVFLSNTTNTQIENVTVSNNLYGIKISNCSASQSPEANYFGIFNSNASSNAWGIYLSNCQNCTVAKNTAMNNALDGIHLSSSMSNSIVDNIAQNNTNGFVLDGSGFNEIASLWETSVASNNNGCGIFVKNSHDNIIWLNNVTANDHYGIHLLYSKDNMITENTIQSNGEGISVRMSPNNTVSSNYVSGNAGELSTTIVSPQGHGIYLGFASNSTVTDNVVENNTQGIHLFASGGSVVKRNTMLGNEYGFGLSIGTSADIDLTNSVDGRAVYYLRNSSDVVLDSSTKASTVYVVDSSNVTVRDLELNKNWCGVSFWNVSNSRIENIKATNNYFSGLYLQSSSYVAISGGEIAGNEINGIYISAGQNNTIFHNNIMDSVIDFGTDNLWDNGAEGNHWINYSGSDLNMDGIGDTPYVFGSVHQDRYPLIQPWSRAPTIPLWSTWWFWLLTSLAVATIVSAPFGIKYYRDFKNQRQLVISYESVLESLPTNHLDRARARYLKDVNNREEKMSDFERKYGIRIRSAKTLEDSAEKSGIQIED